MKATVLIAVVVLGTTGSTGFAQGGRPATCRVTADSSRRVELADGRIVSTDVQSTAVSGGSILAVGRSAYVFPRGSLPVSSPVMRDSIIGFLIDRRGRVSVVPAPLRDRHVYFPVVAAGARGGFHALFVTGGDSLDNVSSPIDSATIWYARYANGTWSQVTRLQSVRGAMLQPEFTSGLVGHDGSLSFLFAFRDEHDGTGIARLHAQAGRWSSDTLRTQSLPTFVRAEHDATRSLVVLFAMQPFRTTEAEQLYVSRFNANWSAPTHVGGSARHAVSDMALVRLDAGLFASWSQWSWPNASTNVLLGSRLDGSGDTPLKPAGIDSGASTYPFAMIAADGQPAWFHIGTPYGQAMSVTIAENSGDVVHHTVSIPLHNPKPRPVALSAQRFIVLTMKRGRTSGESMIASYTTGLTIRCPTSGRR